MMRLPCWNPSNQHSTARTPLPFSFPFIFSSHFSFFVRFSSLFLSFSVSPFLGPFFVRFVLAPYRFPFVSCITFIAFLFASLLSLVADSVILLFRLGGIPPRALLASLKYAYPPCVLSFFLRRWWWLVLFRLLFLPFFDFDLDTVYFFLSSSCGCYAVSSVQVSVATSLAYSVCW